MSHRRRRKRSRSRSKRSRSRRSKSSRIRTLKPIKLNAPIVLGSRKRSKPKSKFLRVLTSPKTTVALLATLGAVLAIPAGIGAGAVAAGARVFGRKAAVSGGRVALRGLGSVVKFGGRQIAKRPITSLVVGGILVKSGTARKAAIQAPGRLFGVGKQIGTGIEQLTPGQKEKGGKFGLPGLALTAVGVGLLATGGVIGAKKVKDKFLSAKNLVPVSASPVSAKAATIQPTNEVITTPLVSMEEPLEKKPSQPRRAKITQNVNINMRQSQSRKFINQINY